MQHFVSSAIAILAAALSGSGEVLSTRRESTGLRTTIPELARSRQLLVVTARDWSAVSAKIRLFERTNGDSWRAAPIDADVLLGRAGLAWGTGLHGTAGGGPVKREGDGRAPAGVFQLIEAFGFASPADARITRFPYRQLASASEGVDDPRSRHYNRIVEPGVVENKDWKSSERMRVEPYRWGAVIAHNWDQVPGAGSCIFLHVWEGADVPTSGCTAMAEAEMLGVLRWLDQRKNPVLVQLPAQEYREVHAAWNLPDLQL